MGGSIVNGELRADALRLAFIIMPVIALTLFAFAAMHDRARPVAASCIYGVAVLLVAAQLVLPALQ
jgi:hypothetical protein